jgi:hypothetical protein
MTAVVRGGGADGGQVSKAAARNISEDCCLAGEKAALLDLAGRLLDVDPTS